jgi:hypothetical protein
VDEAEKGLTSAAAAANVNASLCAAREARKAVGLKFTAGEANTRTTPSNSSRATILTLIFK